MSMSIITMIIIIIMMVRMMPMPVFNEDDEGLYHQQQTLCTSPSFVWFLTQNSRGTYGFSRNQKETCYVRTVTKLQLVSRGGSKLNNPSPALTLMSSTLLRFAHCGKELHHQNCVNNFPPQMVSLLSSFL
jgi:hypothetical protein